MSFNEDYPKQKPSTRKLQTQLSVIILFRWSRNGLEILQN